MNIFDSLMAVPSYSPEAMINFFCRGWHILALLLISLYLPIVKRRTLELRDTIFSVSVFIMVLSAAFVAVVRYQMGLDYVLYKPYFTLFAMAIVPFFSTFLISAVWFTNPKEALLGLFVGSQVVNIVGATFYHSTGYVMIVDGIVVYNIVLAICACTYTVMRVRLYNRLLAESYANITGRSLKWLIHVVCLLVLLYGMSLVVMTLAKFTRDDALDPLVFAITEYLLVSATYYLARQRPVNINLLNTLQKEETGEASVEEEIVPAAGEPQFVKLLKSEFEDKGLYLREDITIRDAALAARTNIRYLSTYLNNELGKNFNQYVNELRVERACKEMEKTNAASEVICSRVGFSSLATFQRVFRQIEGMSPSQYRVHHVKRSVDETLVGEFSAQCPDFQKLLVEEYPAISNREVMLAMLLYLGFDNDAICKYMDISYNSVRVFRSRLRTKMNLERKVSIQEAVQNILAKAGFLKQNA